MTDKKKYNSTLEWLIAKIDEYLALNPHLTEKKFGWRVLKEGGLVPRLRNGGDITTRKLDAIIRYMANPPQEP